MKDRGHAGSGITRYLVGENDGLMGASRVESAEEVLSFEEENLYRVFFDNSEADDGPHADILVDGEGRSCVTFHFVEDVESSEAIERMEVYMQGRRFMSAASKRWGGIEVFWGGPGGHRPYTKPANLTIYHDGQLAFAFMDLFLAEPTRYTYANLREDYQFLREAYETSQGHS